MRYLGPSTSVRVEIDPAAPGTIVRFLLVAEAITNVVIASFVMIWPARALVMLLPSPSDVQPALVTLMQLMGLNVAIMTVPLVLSIPNTASGIEARKLTYWMYVVAEIVMILLFYSYAAQGETLVGLSPESLRTSANQLVIPMMLRLFTVVWKPQWLGRYRIVEDEKSQ